VELSTANLLSERWAQQKALASVVSSVELELTQADSPFPIILRNLFFKREVARGLSLILCLRHRRYFSSRCETPPVDAFCDEIWRSLYLTHV
jgi:hypothetical protein